MKKLTPVFFLLLFGISLTFAQQSNSRTGQGRQDNVTYLSLDSVEAFSIQRALDSLLPTTHYETLLRLETDTAALNTYHFSPDIVPVYTDEEYETRLKALKSPISLDYNSYVQSYINLYTQTRRGQVSRMLGLAHFYYTLFFNSVFPAPGFETPPTVSR